MKHTQAIPFLLAIAGTLFSESIIVDNTPTAPHSFSTDGSWAPATTAEGYYGANYISADSSPTASARWQPQIVTAGYYKIYMRWTSATSRPDRAPVEIVYDGGEKTDATRRVNQKINGGTWVYLGNYYLKSGTNNAVSINASDEGRVCADAVLFDLSYATADAPADPAPTTPRVEHTNDFSIIARPVTAPFTVYYNGGGSSSIVNLNQTTNSSQWIQVGTYYLTAGTGNSVKLSAASGFFTAADAVKFELAANTNLAIIVDNDPPAGSPHVVTTAGTWTSGTSPEGFYGTNYLFSSTSGSALRWRPEIATAGIYNVYARWPESIYEVDHPEEVLIVRTDSGSQGATPVFELRIEGSPFYVKGSCGTEAVEEIAAAGGNTIRAYSVNVVSPDFLRRVSDAGLKIILGVWLTQADPGTANEFFYDDPVSVSNQLETLKTQINSYKDYKAILAWVIGNEIDPATITHPEPLYRAVNQVARYIREVDHYHPSLTSHAGPNQTKIERVVQWTPDLDIVGLNVYGASSISNTTPRAAAAGWRGPVLLTEYFLRPPSGAPSTDWDAAIEAVSADKYTGLLDVYTNNILLQANQLVGSFVFKGSQGGFRVTHTWYPILDDNLKPTPSYDAMRKNWNGPTAPELLAPQVNTITLNGREASDDVVLTNATGLATAAVTVSTPPGATLDYLVEIRTNAALSANYSPPPLTGITITQNSNDPRIFYVKLADLPNGDYRLFYYVRRTDGADSNDYVSVGTANIPFRKMATNTYLLAATSSDLGWGTVTPTGGTYLANSEITLTAEPAPYYHFVEWTGDLSGNQTTTNLHINSHLTVQAVFAENLAINHTPEWWLVKHGLGPNDSAALADSDNDGLTAWQEYIAGTDPTNHHSALRVTASPDHALNWQTVSGRVYTVYWTSNLLAGFQTLESNVPWTANVFTGRLQNATGRGFYKIGVQQAP